MQLELIHCAWEHKMIHKRRSDSTPMPIFILASSKQVFETHRNSYPYPCSRIPMSRLLPLSIFFNSKTERERHTERERERDEQNNDNCWRVGSLCKLFGYKYTSFWNQGLETNWAFINWASANYEAETLLSGGFVVFITSQYNPCDASILLL